MDALDDLAMAMALGLPIVLVAAGAIFVALGDDAEVRDEEPAPEPAPKR